MIFGFLANMENTKALYSYSIPWALFPKKLCVAPEFFVLISSHCSTQIWRMRYGGSSSIYFLDVSIVINPYVEIIFGRIIWCLSNLKDCNILTNYWQIIPACVWGHIFQRLYHKVQRILKGWFSRARFIF